MYEPTISAQDGLLSPLLAIINCTLQGINHAVISALHLTGYRHTLHVEDSYYNPPKWTQITVNITIGL